MHGRMLKRMDAFHGYVWGAVPKPHIHALRTPEADPRDLGASPRAAPGCPLGHGVPPGLPLRHTLADPRDMGTYHGPAPRPP